jgi:hypothetical protein
MQFREGMTTAWSFLTLTVRQHGGNTGYDDAIEQYYSFDSTVPNCRRVRVGDLAAVRNSQQLLGIGWIPELTSKEAHKERRRYPLCHTTDFKTRSTALPRYRCAKRHAFNKPLSEQIATTSYRAIYGSSWKSLRGALDTSTLESITPSNARQHAIRRLDVGRLQRLLEDRVSPEWWARRPTAEVPRLKGACDPK